MPPAELPARKRWLALAVLCVTVLVANLDSTVVNVTLPTLVRDLNATSGDLQWIVDSYIVVFVGSLLAAGSLATGSAARRRCWPAWPSSPAAQPGPLSPATSAP
ncbi:MAG: hypothetical protein WAK82_32815 [Streptosporangiaceae bacterium]